MCHYLHSNGQVSVFRLHIASSQIQEVCDSSSAIYNDRCSRGKISMRKGAGEQARSVRPVCRVGGGAWRQGRSEGLSDGLCDRDGRV